MMMDWIILLLLVPAILVPTVLLCGFAGCGLATAYVCNGDGDCPAGTHCVDGECVTNEVESPPAAPGDLQAAAVSDSEIDLSWTNNEPSATTFEVQRAKEGDTFAAIANPTGETFKDTGLEAGTTFLYLVRAFVGQEPSDPSNQAEATTLFKTAFDVSTEAPTIQNIVGAGDFTFVQRISAGQLLADGGTMAMTVRGALTANVTIHRIYISRAAGAGNPYDSAGDLTPVMTSDLTLPDDQPFDLGPVAYNLDQTQDLIIAFDFSSTATAGNIRFVRRTGVTFFFKEGVQQASAPVRDADYTPAGADPLVYLVTTIGVA